MKVNTRRYWLKRPLPLAILQLLVLLVVSLALAQIPLPGESKPQGAKIFPDNYNPIFRPQREHIAGKPDLAIVGAYVIQKGENRGRVKITVVDLNYVSPSSYGGKFTYHIVRTDDIPPGHEVMSDKGFMQLRRGSEGYGISVALTSPINVEFSPTTGSEDVARPARYRIAINEGRRVAETNYQNNEVGMGFALFPSNLYGLKWTRRARLEGIRVEDNGDSWVLLKVRYSLPDYIVEPIRLRLPGIITWLGIQFIRTNGYAASNVFCTDGRPYMPPKTGEGVESRWYCDFGERIFLGRFSTNQIRAFSHFSTAGGGTVQRWENNVLIPFEMNWIGRRGQNDGPLPDLIGHFKTTRRGARGGGSFLIEIANQGRRDIDTPSNARLEVPVQCYDRDSASGIPVFEVSRNFLLDVPPLMRGEGVDFRVNVPEDGGFRTTTRCVGFISPNPDAIRLHVDIDQDVLEDHEVWSPYRVDNNLATKTLSGSYTIPIPVSP